MNSVLCLSFWLSFNEAQFLFCRALPWENVFSEFDDSLQKHLLSFAFESTSKPSL